MVLARDQAGPLEREGAQFQQLHELFDTLAGALEEHVDLIAERATALGTARMAAGASRLSEYPLDAVDGRQHVEALTARFASLAKAARAAIDTAASFGDMDTSDLFTEVSRGLGGFWPQIQAVFPKQNCLWIAASPKCTQRRSR